MRPRLFRDWRSTAASSAKLIRSSFWAFGVVVACCVNVNMGIIFFISNDLSTSLSWLLNSDDQGVSLPSFQSTPSCRVNITIALFIFLIYNRRHNITKTSRLPFLLLNSRHGQSNKLFRLAPPKIHLFTFIWSVRPCWPEQVYELYPVVLLEMGFPKNQSFKVINSVTTSKR